MNLKQVANLAFQLDDVAGATIRKALQKELQSTNDDLLELLRLFLEVNDANFSARYAFFYDTIATHLVLYSINVGDTLVLTGYGKGGYSRKVPVKVYGTYRFKSLDESPMAGGFNMLDLMTFRDLYGYMTQERLKEIDEIRADVGSKDISREDAEDAMFGDNSEPVEETGKSQSFDETAGIDLKTGGTNFSDEISKRVYSNEEIENGPVPNAAIMLADGIKLVDAQKAIQAKIEASNLGLNLVTWRDASGLVGNFIVVIRLVLYVAVFIIFIVALVIINNSLVMSTLERTREIGTMRAIGAQRGFIMRMFLVETGVLSFVFGGLGALLGSGIMMALNQYGIAAWDRITVFMFAGPRLYPELLPKHLFVALGVIIFVGLASTLYPARLATRIAPVVAMQDEE
ncbi:MAG TPA: ABC transporter permease [Myxococcales bacterium]|nr:ABC transporter permease [Myxococcales bacterium]